MPRSFFEQEPQISQPNEQVEKTKNLNNKKEYYNIRKRETAVLNFQSTY